MESDESMVGQRFGRLTIRRRSGSRDGKREWLCDCSCGGTALATTGELRGRRRISCGCKRRENAARYFNLHARRPGGGTFAEDDALAAMLMDD